MMGYTPGGSPIIFGPTAKKAKSKTLYKCSVDPKHRTTKNQAKITGGKCIQCKSWLADTLPREDQRHIYVKQMLMLQEKLDYLDSKENE